MKDLRFAQIGSGLMGKAYGLALADLPMNFWPPAMMPRRVLLVDATEAGARDNAARFGYDRWAVGWESAVADPEVEALCIITPNSLHRDIVIAAAEAGKHISCEKPLAMNAKQAKEMYDAVEKAGVTHQTGFNWRFAPAVQMAKRMIDEGRLGRIYDFRGWWLADWPMDPDVPLTWRFRKTLSGGGALADIGSHAIDLGRFLVGEVNEVCGLVDTYIKKRAIVDPFAPPATKVTSERSQIEYGDVDVDDNASFICKFENGAIGHFSASHFSAGRKHSYGFELHAEKGTIYFDWQHMNELQFYSRESPSDTEGFRSIIMGPQHPFGGAFWPVQGYGIGYTETKVLQMNDFVEAVAHRRKPQTDFYDGWKTHQIADAVLLSAQERTWIKVSAV